MIEILKINLTITLITYLNMLMKNKFIALLKKQYVIIFVIWFKRYDI